MYKEILTNIERKANRNLKVFHTDNSEMDYAKGMQQAVEDLKVHLKDKNIRTFAKLLFEKSKQTDYNKYGLTHGFGIGYESVLKEFENTIVKREQYRGI